MTNANSRVLGRKGARIVTETETEAVNGGILTETICTFDPCGGTEVDGDLFTGDCIAN
jgi:hypothetical protein